MNRGGGCAMKKRQFFYVYIFLSTYTNSLIPDPGIEKVSGIAIPTSQISGLPAPGVNRFCKQSCLLTAGVRQRHRQTEKQSQWQKSTVFQFLIMYFGCNKRILAILLRSTESRRGGIMSNTATADDLEPHLKIIHLLPGTVNYEGLQKC